jgi:hypothetical protein
MRFFQLGEEIDARHQRHRADVGAGDHRAVDVDRVARVGHEHGVAAVQRGQHQVGQALLGADGDDGFRVRVDIDGVAVLVPLADGPAQARNALAGRVAVGVGPLRDLGELGHDVRGVAPSGLPMLMSMMSSPRRRAASLSSAVMLKT